MCRSNLITGYFRHVNKMITRYHSPSGVTFPWNACLFLLLSWRKLRVVVSFTRFDLPQELRQCTVCYSVSVPFITECSFQRGVAELQGTDNNLLVRRSDLCANVALNWKEIEFLWIIMSLFRCNTPLNFSRPLRKTMFYGYILPGKEAQQLGRGSKLSTILTQRILSSRIRTFSKNTVSHWKFFSP